MLTDERFRERVVKGIDDPFLRSFWEGEFDKYSSEFASEAIAPVLNKVGRLAMSPMLRNIIGQPQSGFDPAFMMDKEERKLSITPPLYSIFGYRSGTDVFETFALWFESRETPKDYKLHEKVTFNKMLVCALDKGILKNAGDGHMQRWVAVSSEEHVETVFPCRVYDKPVEVDPAKSLFLFLETLWQMLWQLPRHPGFDIRSYMDADLGEVIPVDSPYLFGIKDAR